MASTDSHRRPPQRGTTELLRGEKPAPGGPSWDDRERSANVSLGFFERLWNQARLFASMLQHYRRGQYRQFPWMAVAALVVGALYLLNPFDIVPDVLFPIGEIDDGFVLFMAWKLIERDLKKFVDWKGLDPRQYF